MDQPAGRQHGILRPSESARRIEVDRATPPAGLAAYVDYFWSVRWETVEPSQQQVLPAPVVHITAERMAGVPRLVVTGVQRRRFDQVLEGRGFVVAAAFRPACFRPFTGGPVADLLDARRPADEIIGLEDAEVAAAILGCDEPDAVARDLLARWLQAADPQPDPRCGELVAILERAEADRSLTRAEQLADLAGVSLRTLQRQFTEYVGVSPKWVVQSFRLLDAAAVAHAGGPVDWAQVALDLGFSDQSHLVRAFARLVGEPPAAYTRKA